MSNVMEWKTATEVIEILKQQNLMVAGMSVAEAATALGFTKTASGIFVKTIVTTTASSTASATAGAATGGLTVGATTSAANLVLFNGGAGGTASVGGLATVATPIAASMAAAAGGYLIGKKIGEENDEFFSKLMYPLFDFITGQNIADSLYEDVPTYDPQYVQLSKVPTIPIIFDQNGSTFMDSRLKLKIKEVLESISREVGFKEINHSQFNGPVTVYHMKSGDSLKFCSGSSYSSPGTKSSHFIELEEGEVFVVITEGLDKYNYLNINCNIVSTTPFKLYKTTRRNVEPFISRSLIPHLTAVKDKVTYYYTYNGINFNPTNLIFDEVFVKTSNLISTSNLNINNPILYDILNSTSGENFTALPSGVTKYPPGPSTTDPLTFPDEIPDWEEVTLPDPPTEPGTMPDPKEFPETPAKPDKITPYINPIQPQPKDVPIKKPDPDKEPSKPVLPSPNPFPDTSTDPVPPPDPSKDPSKEKVPVPPTEEVPTEIPEPEDSGTTPEPIIPIVPPITSSATGLLHVYNPTNNQINEFGSWLWTTFSGDLMETLSKLFNNPMDAVIGLHEIYCTPSTGSVSTIKAGFLDSEVASRLVSSRYISINCGAVGVPEYWHNYLDYSPYTKSFCYLPFIGIVELNTDDIVGSGVEISYKIDTYNGSCIAMITTAKSSSNESLSYQFSGNCAVEIPITSGMKSATQGALLGAAVAGLASSVATGGGGAVLGATAVGGMRGTSNSKNSVQHSGTFGSSYGAMGLKKPYLIIKRPKQKVVAGYNDNYGYPAHKMVHIAKCSGYLKAIEVDVVSPTATEDEKKLIEEQLKSGIFVD